MSPSKYKEYHVWVIKYSFCITTTKYDSFSSLGAFTFVITEKTCWPKFWPNIIHPFVSSGNSVYKLSKSLFSLLSEEGKIHWNNRIFLETTYQK